MMLGRAIQGAGAISAALMALVADLTRDQQRTKAMALIGISIGVAFSLAFVAGPVLDAMIGVSGIFLFSAALAVLAIVVLYLMVPDPQHSSFHSDAEVSLAMLGSVFKDHLHATYRVDGQLYNCPPGFTGFRRIGIITSLAGIFTRNDNFGRPHGTFYHPGGTLK